MQERASPSGTKTDTLPGDVGEEPQLAPGNATFVAFAGRLGHDLNNLLSTVIGSLGLLREDGAGSPEAETLQLIDDALSAPPSCPSTTRSPRATNAQSWWTGSWPPQANNCCARGGSG